MNADPMFGETIAGVVSQVRRRLGARYEVVMQEYGHVLLELATDGDTGVMTVAIGMADDAALDRATRQTFLAAAAHYLSFELPYVAARCRDPGATRQGRPVPVPA